MSNFISSAFQAHFKRGSSYSRLFGWLVAVMFITATAYGVHIMHKKAFAQPITFTVYLHEDDVPINDQLCRVFITFYKGEDVHFGDDMVYQQTGIWIYTEDPPDSEWTHWDAHFDDVDPDWEVNGILPPGTWSPKMEVYGGGAQLFLDWEAELIPVP